jgi:hypothetical protein
MTMQFGPEKFRRELEKQIQAGVDELARQQTKKLEDLRRQFAGETVAAIKPELQALFAEDGREVTDPELTEWTEAISAGTKIEIRPTKVQW